MTQKVLDGQVAVSDTSVRSPSGPAVNAGRNRRAVGRNDAAAEGRLQQGRAIRALRRLLWTLLIIVLVVATTGYALALWWG